MTTLTATAPPLTTNPLSPAIEPSNQPIPSHANYMSKAAGGGELGAIAESGAATTAGAASVGEEEKNDAGVPPLAGVRILKKTMSTDSMLDDKSTAGGNQSSSGGGTPSSTKQRKYERKTKRFIWPDELHRLFVAAIFDVGLKNASPKALLGLMGAAGPDSGLTTEHLKSHLQKYRLNYERSRAEFLEFYDHSAKKNLKRRRKNGNKPGEHNTMFVFPISHKKRKNDGENGDGGDDSDDSGSEDDSDDDAVEEMSDSTLEHTTPRGSGAGVSLLERTGSFTSMMQQDPKDPMAAAAVAAAYAQRSQQQQQQQIQIQNSLLSSSAMNDPRASFSSNQSAVGNNNTQAQAMAAAYAASQRKASLSGGGSNNSRAMAAAAAAAAAAFRYPLVPQMGAGGGPGSASGGQLGDLSDPQWNILTSLMSPHITGMNGGGNGNGVMPTSEGMNGGGGDQFQLHDEPNDLQLQMHLAMQAQMNLHRQMLTRKVEVSQHLINSQHDGSNNNNGGNNNTNNYGLGWGANAQQQQQQHHQQQQRQHHQQYFQQDQQQQRAVAAAAARQVLANSSHHPQMQMNLAANAAGMSSSSSNQTPRPSLAPRNNNSSSMSVTTSAMSSSSLGMGNMYASASGQRGGLPISVGPVDVVNVLLNDNGGSADGTLGASLGFDKNSGGPPGATASAAPVDDDSLDLYRWDRIDLNVELDDDDLFGFLKS